MHFGQHYGQHYGQHAGGIGEAVVEAPAGPPVIYCVRLVGHAASLAVISHAAAVTIVDGCDV